MMKDRDVTKESVMLVLVPKPSITVTVGERCFENGFVLYHDTRELSEVIVLWDILRQDMDTGEI